MEYLAAIFGLGIMCGCALGAYALLDTIDREQEEDHTRAAERALLPDGEMSAPLRVATLRPPMRFEHPQSSSRGRPPHEHPRQGGSVAAYTDWLEARVGASKSSSISSSATACAPNLSLGREPPAVPRLSLRVLAPFDPSRSASAFLSVTLGADDGIRTRDPHLGKASGFVRLVAPKRLTCAHVRGSTRLVRLKRSCFVESGRTLVEQTDRYAPPPRAASITATPGA
jgi:hypothetical protein